MRLYAITGLLLASMLSSAGLAAGFGDDFSRGLGSTYWYVTMTTPGMYSVNATQGDVRLAKIAPTPGGFQDVEIVLDLTSLTSSGAVAGDFDIEVSFRDAVISGSGLNQVELHTAYANGTIFFLVRDKNNVHVWTGGYQSEVQTTATSGRFRITRTGSTVTGYFNDTYVWSSSSYGAPLNWVAFSLQNNQGSNDQTSVTYDDFRLIASDIFPPASSPKLLADGTPLSISGYSASSGADDFAGFFYAQAADRHEGIRVAAHPDTASSLSRDDVVEVSGVMGTTDDGERQIEAWSVGSIPASSRIRPLGMTNYTLGGADTGLPPLGQYGVSGGYGLNNIGLLIRTCGRVKYTEDGILLDDGSGAPVKLDESTLTRLPSDGSFALVTGISSLSLSESKRLRAVLPRDDADVLGL